MKWADTGFACLTLILGIYVVANGANYGYMSDGRPDAGFFPILVGFGIIVLSGVNILRALVGAEVIADHFDKMGLAKTAGMLAVLAIFLLTVPYVGMLLGSVPLVLALGFVINPSTSPQFLKFLVPVALLFPVAAWLIFSVNLGVRLIEGPLGF